jgi:hypothetical protein
MPQNVCRLQLLNEALERSWNRESNGVVANTIVFSGEALVAVTDVHEATELVVPRMGPSINGSRYCADICGGIEGCDGISDGDEFDGKEAKGSHINGGEDGDDEGGDDEKITASSTEISGEVRGGNAKVDGATKAAHSTHAEAITREEPLLEEVRIDDTAGSPTRAANGFVQVESFTTNTLPQETAPLSTKALPLETASLSTRAPPPAPTFMPLNASTDVKTEGAGSPQPRRRRRSTARSLVRPPPHPQHARINSFTETCRGQ